MAASDWKGVAMVLQQLGEMAKPSELDIIDRRYELESLEKQADREHQFMLKNFEIAQNQYYKLQEQYKASMTEGEGIDAELNKLKGTELNFSGEAQKVHNAIYGNQFTNYDAGIKMLNDNINKLQNDITAAEDINQAGKLGGQFTKDYKLGGKNYFDDAQILRDRDGNIMTQMKADENGGFVRNDIAGTYEAATEEEKHDITITKFSEQSMVDELIDDMSYNEALYAIGQASLQLPEGNQRDAFVLAAEGTLNQEDERQEEASKLLAKGKTEETKNKTDDEKVELALANMESYYSDDVQKTLDEMKMMPGIEPIGKYKRAATMQRIYLDGLSVARKTGQTHLFEEFGIKHFEHEAKIDKKTKETIEESKPTAPMKGMHGKGLSQELYDIILDKVHDGTIEEKAAAMEDKRMFHILYYGYAKSKRNATTMGQWTEANRKLHARYGLK
tara:strand:+ start:3278 stop:4615 length:1338 start_codon:yes stop_codon:yes gene_type:complete